jgi:hypothetical protein
MIIYPPKKGGKKKKSHELHELSLKQPTATFTFLFHQCPLDAFRFSSLLLERGDAEGRGVRSKV